tara:strand:- start:57 stop:287 length:231 start_codon:yes stop_codon:yes gene_type:complete
MNKLKENEKKHLALPKEQVNSVITLYSISKIEEAIKRYRPAIKLKMDYIDTHLNLGIVFKELENIENGNDYFCEYS